VREGRAIPLTPGQPYIGQMSAKLPDLDALAGRLSASIGDVWKAVVSPSRDPAQEAEIAAKATLAAPVVWLVGKVQSGKSSIVRALTGATEAEVGSGFKACTATSRIYDHPADAPVIRFLDTRGLGEAAYDPAADIAVAEAQAHLLLVVMKATDAAQDAILDVVAAARTRHPEWPILVAQTSLHEAYPPGVGHAIPYPFDADGKPTGPLPGDLARVLAWQRAQCQRLPGTGAIGFTPIDFTQPGDGLYPQLYGLEALRESLVRVAPAAVSAAVMAEAGSGGAIGRQTHQHILGYAAAAGAIDAVPVAGAVGVPAVQAKMLHSLAEIHGVTWDRRMMGELAGALGAGVLARMASTFGARQLAKLVPVYGQTAGAAVAATMSFATTYAIGKAACVYLDRRRSGTGGVEGVKEAYEEALRGAFKLAADRFKSTDAEPSAERGPGATAGQKRS
jgi:uncharacterized protein (DUF697 family)